MNNDILQRYIEGNSTQQEKEKIAEWLDTDSKNMEEFLLLRNLYDASVWSGRKYPSLLKDKEHFEESGRYYRKKISIAKEILKIAAIFLIAFGCYHIFISPETNVTNTIQQTVHAPEGQRAEIMLADGTKVWLNAKSSLNFPNQFNGGERIVELDGEAYFDVTHDEEKKFIVKTCQYDIKVHGTKFNVNAYKGSGRFETSLIEGSVEVVSNETEQSVMLLPNNKVYADNDKLVLKNIENQDQFLWKEGILFVDNKKVEELLKDLELYYDVEIEVRNKNLLSHQYTGKFWIKDGVEHVLRVLQFRHNFKYKKDNLNKIVIY